MVAVYLLVIPLSQGGPRFRVPAEPLMALLAGLIFVAMHQESQAKVPANNLEIPQEVSAP